MLLSNLLSLWRDRKRPAPPKARFLRLCGARHKRNYAELLIMRSCRPFALRSRQMLTLDSA